MQYTIDGRLREEADYVLFHLLTELMNPIYIDLVDVHQKLNIFCPFFSSENALDFPKRHLERRSNAIIRLKLHNLPESPSLRR